LETLLIIIAGVFAGLALLVAFGRRFGKEPDAASIARLQRWILPLVALLLVVRALEYLLTGA
jgi:hypothetical protein